jgi:hypothetical protein
VRLTVEEDGAGAALGAVAAELGPGEPELVTQRHRQLLVGEHVDATGLAIHLERDQPLGGAGGGLRADGPGLAEEIAGAVGGRAARDHSLDEATPRDDARAGFSGRRIVLVPGLIHVNHLSSDSDAWRGDARGAASITAAAPDR